MSLLRIFAGQNRVTINTILQAVWSLLIYRYTSSDDVIFGTTGNHSNHFFLLIFLVSGRFSEIPDIENMVGMFINTVPVRVKMAGKNFSVRELVKLIHDQNLSSLPHAGLSLTSIKECSKVPPSIQKNFLRIFQKFP